MAEGRLLVTGGTGQVGRAFARLAAGAGYEVCAPPRAELDLADEGSIRTAVEQGGWTGVVNCGAYTAVDPAEAEPELARAINAAAPRILARATARLGIPIVHVSTDYVFDGRKPEPYVEDDRPGPLNVYGRTKAEGEQAIREENPRHAIARTSWVVSESGRNFVTTMISLARSNPEIRVVDDQIGSPTAAGDLAEALLVLARHAGSRAGTWHFANAGEVSWFGLAGFLFERLEATGRPVPRLVPIPTEQRPAPAARPANSRLSTLRFEADFGIAPRPWREAVGEVVDRILADPAGPPP